MNKQLFGDELDHALEVRPPYSQEILTASMGEREEALSALDYIFCATEMAGEIYHWLYRAASAAMQRKPKWIEAVREHYSRQPAEVIGGTTTMSFLGESGIGKTRAVVRATELIAGHDMWFVDGNPIIPFLFVHCPAAGVKSLLLEIMDDIDRIFGTEYRKVHDKRSSIDLMLDCVLDLLSNSVAVLIVDEIQNFRGERDAANVITKLVNNGFVSTVFIGTPEADELFKKSAWLARRMVGPTFNPLNYEPEFRQVAKVFLSYRFTETSDSDSKLIAALYEGSCGRISDLVSLLKSAESASIKNNVCLSADLILNRKNELHRDQTVESQIKGGRTTSSHLLVNALKIAKEKGKDPISALRQYVRVDIIR